MRVLAMRARSRQRDLVRRPAHELGETLRRVHVPPVASYVAGRRYSPREPGRSPVQCAHGRWQRHGALRRSGRHGVDAVAVIKGQHAHLPRLAPSRSARIFGGYQPECLRAGASAQSSVYREPVVLEQPDSIHRIVTDGEFARGGSRDRQSRPSRRCALLSGFGVTTERRPPGSSSLCTRRPTRSPARPASTRSATGWTWWGCARAARELARLLVDERGQALRIGCHRVADRLAVHQHCGRARDALLRRGVGVLPHPSGEPAGAPRERRIRDPLRYRSAGAGRS